MKISLDWLGDYVDTGLGAERIAESLSGLGLPCEGIEYLDHDTVIDVEVTSNRSDCLSHIGIARELAAVTGKQLRMPSVEFTESDRDVGEFAGVEIHEPDLCGRYTARVIEGVKVGPSPDWLRRRLEAVGLRSVNNVVDATNYAMMETGQPPHAFDYAKITGGSIIVRKAAAGERIVSIDGTQCELDPEMLVIADPRGPVAIAGVMGGLQTEVSDHTTTILLEDAYFDPVGVRTTSRKLGLPSEAAFRFERIVDIETVDWASKRTVQLIIRVAGGRAAKGVADIYPRKWVPREVTLRLSRLKGLLGVEVPYEEVVRILSLLSFEPQDADGCVVCKVPSWRSDIYREVDLIEEVGRVHGYHKIPTKRRIEIEAVPADARQEFVELVGTYLNGCGFYETISVGFVDEHVADLFTDSKATEHLSVRDESRRSSNLLRQTLLGSLLGVLKTNINAGNLPCSIFEIADTFVPTGSPTELPIERAKLSLVCDSELRYLRGAIEGLVRSISRDAQVDFSPADLAWTEVGATVSVNGAVVGSAGVFSQTVTERFDLKGVIACGAELDFEQLMLLQSGPVIVKPIPRFPAIRRDLSLILDENVRWVDLAEAVKSKASDELEDIQFVGIYRGRGIPSDKKSVTLSLLFRDADGTLTHEKVDRFQVAILESLKKAVGAELRAL